jgi:ABC-2 type transport system ATP-binding protein
LNNSPGNEKRGETMSIALKAENLTKRLGWWNPRILIDSLNMTVESGRTLGLLGPNGAGKTTAFKLFLGLMRPTSGVAELFGVPVSRPAAREGVGFLPEVVNHPDYLQVGEYLQFHARLAKIPEAEQVARQQEALQKTGMGDAEPLRLVTLSKGMRQRVELARVLMLKPRLVFLDEPVSGLDPLGQVTLKEILLELRRDEITLIINSHAVDILTEVCDEFAFLSGGRIVRQGPSSEILASTGFRLIFSGPKGNVAKVLSGLTAGEVVSGGDTGPWNMELPSSVLLGKRLGELVTAGATILEAGPRKPSLGEVFSGIFGAASKPNAVTEVTT